MKIGKMHIEFSKLIVALCFIMFFIVLKIDIDLIKSNGSMVVTFCVTTITSVSGILATSVGFYFNKSKTYNNIAAQYDWLQKEYEFKLAHPEVFGKVTGVEFDNTINKVNTAFDNKMITDTTTSINETIK